MSTAHSKTACQKMRYQSGVIGAPKEVLMSATVGGFTRGTINIFQQEGSPLNTR